ncbi:alpha/beta hydrolase [Sphingobacterium cellulitidis]|uniref:alpha/beta hydrolase n=1 Tax=Sphingobacterium cellulitidis TaxID=1768011 RepID=UPI000B941AC8|nr:hypothetical protein CHT99_03540 [Sphingobacterium cellulitidis]
MKHLYTLVFLLTILILPAKSQDLSAQEIKELNQEIIDQLFPGTLNKELKFDFKQPFQEVMVPINDSIKLNGLYFPTKHPKGLIFYLHGSIGDLGEWSKIAPIYTNLHYDLFMIDYRGYGKSDGEFLTEDHWYADMQKVYEFIKKTYAEESKIIILGQSLGTAAASYLSAHNNPGKLILQAPFYNFKDWTYALDPNLNSSILNLKLDNRKYLEQTKAPVIIFHGDHDKAVYYGSSEKLKETFKKGDQLITLKGEGHNDFTKNPQYLKEIKKVLN